MFFSWIKWQPEQLLAGQHSAWVLQQPELGKKLNQCLFSVFFPKKMCRAQSTLTQRLRSVPAGSYWGTFLRHSLQSGSADPSSCHIKHLWGCLPYTACEILRTHFSGSYFTPSCYSCPSDRQYFQSFTWMLLVALCWSRVKTSEELYCRNWILFFTGEQLSCFLGRRAIFFLKMLIDCSQSEVTVESSNRTRRNEVRVTVTWVSNVYIQLFVPICSSFSLGILNHSWAVPVEFYVVSWQMLLILNTTCSALWCFCISEDYMLTYCFASWALINISVLILSNCTAGLTGSEIFLFCPERVQSR